MVGVHAPACGQFEHAHPQSCTCVACVACCYCCSCLLLCLHNHSAAGAHFRPWKAGNHLRVKHGANGPDRIRNVQQHGVAQRNDDSYPLRLTDMGRAPPSRRAYDQTPSLVIIGMQAPSRCCWHESMYFLDVCMYSAGQYTCTAPSLEHHMENLKALSAPSPIRAKVTRRGEDAHTRRIAK